MSDAAALRAELENTKTLARSHITRFKTAYEESSKACVQQAAAIAALRTAVSTSLSELDHLARLITHSSTPLATASIDRLRTALRAVLPDGGACVACGHTPLPSGSAFCSECGATQIVSPVTAAPAKPATSVEADQPQLNPTGHTPAPSGTDGVSEGAAAVDRSAPSAAVIAPATELSVGELRRRLAAAGVQYDAREVLEKADLAALLALAEGGGVASGTRTAHVPSDAAAATSAAREPSLAAAQSAQPVRASSSGADGGGSDSPAACSEGAGADAAGAAADGWVEVRLQDGRVYFYHRITRATRWQRPEPAVAARLEARVAAEEEATARRQAERLAGLAAAEAAAEEAKAVVEQEGRAAQARVDLWAEANGWKGLKPMRKAVKAAAAAAVSRGEAPEGVAAAAVAEPSAALACMLASLHSLEGLGSLVPRPLLTLPPTAAAAGVDAGALKRAFFAAMKALHPDKTGGAPLSERLTAQAAFAAVSSAQACLQEVRERAQAKQQPAPAEAAADDEA